MSKRNIRISDEQFIELLRGCRIDRPAAADEVPAHADMAAQRAFRQMESWIAAGMIPAAAGIGTAAGIGAARGLGHAAKALAITVGAAAVLGAGAYVLSPAVHDAVSIPHIARIQAAKQARAPEDYEIPSPGEGYELREDVSGEAMIAKWFVAEDRLLMVQIAYQLPEAPDGEGKYVEIGGMTGAAYDVDGDQELLIRDGAVCILIKMFNAEREELLDYARTFAAANTQ